MVRTRLDGSPEEALAAPGRVLLVDDQPELRRLFRRHLARLGHDVVEACDGRAAIALARREYFDVVISDVRMPDLSGVELLQELYELDSDLPVVLVSGGLDDQAAQAAAEFCAFEYLMKPVPFEHMQSSTARAIELRRSRARAKEETEPYASHQRLRVPEPHKP